MALPIARAAAMADTLYSIDDLLEQMVARNASDLHVAVGAHPVVRVRGKLEPLQEIPPLTRDMTQQLLYRDPLDRAAEAPRDRAARSTSPTRFRASRASA